MLPDEALLEIFHFYKDDSLSMEDFNLTWRWRTLIHVCQRWRHIIFGSPRRLELRLVCTDRTPARRLLDIWPPFPIYLFVNVFRIEDEEGSENIMAALERHDRISYINLYDMGDSGLEKLTAAMHEPFPVLRQCILLSWDKSISMPVLPATFLGGFAPHLDFLNLFGIPFPTFPDFILSSTQIRHLVLNDIPDSGYISPDVMATCLAALPNLTQCFIGFRSPLSRPVRTTPPLTRSVLPALTSLSFHGVSEYFEAFIAQIDTPQLGLLKVTFFMDLIFDIPQLHNFIHRKERAKKARMEFTSKVIEIILESQNSQPRFELGIKCERLDWQLSSMTQTLSQQLPLLSHIEHLEIREPHDSYDRIWWEDNPDMDPSQWLELFRLLISVQSLYVSERLVRRVATALKGVTGEMTMEVLPTLHNLSLEGLEPSGPVRDALKSFVTARQPTSHPVAIQPWERPKDDG